MKSVAVVVRILSIAVAVDDQWEPHTIHNRKHIFYDWSEPSFCTMLRLVSSVLSLSGHLAL